MFWLIIGWYLVIGSWLNVALGITAILLSNKGLRYKFLIDDDVARYCALILAWPVTVPVTIVRIIRINK